MVLRLPRPDDAERTCRRSPTTRTWRARWARPSPPETVLRRRLRDERATASAARPPATSIDDDGRLRGLVLLHSFAWEHLRADVGLHARARGARPRGRAEAMQLLVRWAFDVLGLQRVGLQTLPDNRGARALAERAGFTTRARCTPIRGSSAGAMDNVDVRHMGLIERYRERLPFAAEDPVVSLGEGSTPLVLAERVSERVGAEVWLKLEGLNPTGLLQGPRDDVRGVARPCARARRPSSARRPGNTAASAAAYAGRAGLTGAVIVPEGKIATGKLAQALMHGAKVIALQGNFDQALEIVRELAEHHPIGLVNSVNPFRLEGQKTAAFEILEELGSIDALSIPVGNAGNITAYWKGFSEIGRSRRGCSAGRRRAPRRWCTARRSRTRRRSRARSASATPRAGRRRWAR